LRSAALQPSSCPANLAYLLGWAFTNCACVSCYPLHSSASNSAAMRTAHRISQSHTAHLGHFAADSAKLQQVT